MSHFYTSFDFSVHHDIALHSVYLQRNIVLDIVLPSHYHSSGEFYKVLYMNDGQDLERLHLLEVLKKSHHSSALSSFIVIAVHCGERIMEYGTASQADYKERGAKAGDYTSFILHELMPHIESKYRVLKGPEHTVFCGFSLGGLSAFDITWHHPSHFGKAGVFSGSFWWRQRAFDEYYDDYHDRIMHRLVRESPWFPPHSKPHFWLQTGTEDETDDRNNNGVIDSIDDTLDLIAELEKKGYRLGEDVCYVEVLGGQHNQETWAAIMPEFLRWAFGR
ncbi:alpha/beta hydrolase-fold protein [Runella sp. MFBS21]|uniref:alpha/beta hydrolase n=1 Tax=Runella sp. MFBS21 TaxID=3034018 RepID=UPI0023F6D6C5|nr:alpha/beta hydrolase-fold protein [Runella sp. MFBS21]MDF7819499.1 alpha/beta hydrolase-fold protein [Runella sp. MFBS21]